MGVESEIVSRLGSLLEAIQRIEAKFDRLDARLDRIEHGIDRIGEHFETLDLRLRAVEARLGPETLSAEGSPTVH